MKFPHVYKFILMFLSLFGINNSTSRIRHVFSFILKAFMIIIFLDSIVLILMNEHISQWMMIFELSSSSIFSFVSLFTLHRNREKLNLLLSTIDKCFKFTKKRRYNVFSTCILILLPVQSIALLATFYVDGDAYYFDFYTYNATFKYEWMKFVIVYIKQLALYISHPILPAVLAALYCKLCNQCCSALEGVIHRMEQCKPMEFTAQTQKMFLNSRETVINMLDDIQDVFSVVSFTVCCAHFAGCLGAVAFFTTIGGISMVVEALFMAPLSLFCLCWIFWTGGGVSMQMQKFREVFNKQLENRAEFAFESTSLSRMYSLDEDYEMSGCGLIIYNRHAIIDVLASILTYGLLIMSIELRKQEFKDI